MLGNGWTYLILGHTKESLDYYRDGGCIWARKSSGRILRNYPASWGIMLGNGWTYPRLGRPKESVDQYTRARLPLF